MPITVELQDMFSYSVIMMMAAFIMALIAVISTIIVVCTKKKTSESRPVKQQSPTIPAEPLNKNRIKQKYMAMLHDLENNSRSSKISNRQAYQELSRIVRQFASEVTGLKVQNYILEEINRMNLPELYAMIAECYAPEFAWNNNGNLYESISKARKVIEEWN